MPGITATADTAPYKVPLTGGRTLCFDHAEGVYRVAWYEPQRAKCDVCKGAGLNRSGPGLCKECHGRRFVTRTVRQTGKAASLADAVAGARGETVASLDTALLVQYVFSTPWGEGLPGAGSPFPADLVESVKWDVRAGDDDATAAD